MLYDSNATHYVWIKKFSTLDAGRTKHVGTSFVCNSCLSVFRSQRVLDAHIPNCLQHAPQQVQYPDPDDCKLKFKDYDKQLPLNFYLVCDFESFLTPATDDDNDLEPDAKTHVVDHHNVSGFCCYRVTDLPQYQTPPKVYSGPDVMSHFYEHVMSESQAISTILSQQIPLSPMSDDDLRRHRTVTIHSHMPTTRSDTTVTSRANTYFQRVIGVISS